MTSALIDRAARNERILDLWSERKSDRQISSLAGASISVVRNVVRQARERGDDRASSHRSGPRAQVIASTADLVEDETEVPTRPLTMTDIFGPVWG